VHVGAPKHAEYALAAGVDIICAQGGEGGGHTGSIPTSLLIPAGEITTESAFEKTLPVVHSSFSQLSTFAREKCRRSPVSQWLLSLPAAFTTAEAWPCRCATAHRCSPKTKHETPNNFSPSRLFGLVPVSFVRPKLARRPATSRRYSTRGERESADARRTQLRFSRGSGVVVA
jgi:hypothetical protein